MGIGCPGSLANHCARLHLAADSKDRGREAVVPEHRQGVAYKIRVPIIEGKRHGPRWDRLFAAHTRQYLVQVQYPVAETLQEGHLAGESAVVTIVRPVLPHGREFAHLVVHENRDPVGHKDLTEGSFHEMETIVRRTDPRQALKVCPARRQKPAQNLYRYT